MLFPEMLHFTSAESVVLDSIWDDLTAVGFDLSNLGGGSYSINGIPSGTEGLNHAELIRNMVCDAIEKGSDVKDEIRSGVALSLAKSAAIVPGQVLSDTEMNELVESLFACNTPNYTPDGKKTLAVVTMDDIHKLFK